MADRTAIEWCDATWNPVRGCSRVSPGCGGANHEGGCYAERIAARFSGPGQPFEGFARRTPHGGQWTGRMALVEAALDLPLRWKKPRRIFVNSMSDLFHENLPDAAIDRVFAVMALAPWHTFQALTKRAARMLGYAAEFATPGRIGRHLHATAARTGGDAFTLHQAQDRLISWPLPNCWLGVSVEDQARKQRIDDLRETPAAIRFLSLEPLLEDLGAVDLTGISWVISGGESGPGARGASRQWYRSIRDQCQAAGVAYFHKQNGEWIDADEWLGIIERGPAEMVVDNKPWQPAGPLNLDDARALAQLTGRRDREIEHHSDGSTLIRVGKAAAGRLLDGREHSEFPGMSTAGFITAIRQTRSGILTALHPDDAAPILTTPTS